MVRKLLKTMGIVTKVPMMIHRLILIILINQLVLPILPPSNPIMVVAEIVLVEALVVSQAQGEVMQVLLLQALVLMVALDLLIHLEATALALIGRMRKNQQNLPIILEKVVTRIQTTVLPIPQNRIIILVAELLITLPRITLLPGA
jgi:hypothetical protein